MKKLRKAFAVILSLAMVLGMSLTTFAADPNPDKISGQNEAKATVNNVEAKATVTAYRIVEPEYNDYGLIGYKRVAKITEQMLKNPLEPTSNEVTAIADQISTKKLDLGTGVEFSAGSSDENGLATFTAMLNPGYWVVIVTGSDIQEVYNPMLVGVYYSVSGSNSTLTSDAVDANSNWSLESTPAYAKSEQPKIDKKITGQSGEQGSDGNDSGDDVAVGDIVNFEIDTQIPSYSDSYSEVQVSITDKMSKGLELADEVNLVVKVGGTGEDDIVKAGADTYKFTPDQDKKGFTIAFESDFALKNSGAKVYVTYDAKLVDASGLNFDANENEAKLIYTNDPSGNTNEIKDKTYTYTFGIDAEINGRGSKPTDELLKTGEVRQVGEELVDETTGLKGAKFKLTNNAIENDKGQEATSDENGHIRFTGLDAGTYTLVETAAPEGYSLNSAEIPVVISAKYNDDGTLQSYSIMVGGTTAEADGVKVTTYTMQTDKIIKTSNTDTNIEGEDVDPSDTYEIKNTTLASLPSTGGIGTTIFTIGGCIIMVAAAGLFFASRRKSSK